MGETAAQPRLSVIVPAYREAAVIGATVGRLRAELAEVAGAGGVELVVADDGSDDATAAEARAAGADQVLSLPRHRGKGAAVRAGMAVARGRSVVFCDADLAYAPDQVVRVLGGLEAGFDVAVGTRRHQEAVTLVRRRRARELSGRAFSALTDALVVGARHDTQCGIKGFTAAAGREVFGRARIDGFAFDVEIFVLVDRLGLSLTEVPVELTNSRRSSVRLGRHALHMLADVARVRWWLARGAYGTPGAPREAEGAVG